MHRPHRGLVLAALCLASFAINLDTTIVNVALPTLVREIGATTRELQWIVDAYNLAFAALVLAAGSVSDRVGRKGALLCGLAVFAGGSALGGLAATPGQLIAVRAVMGVGAAVIFPTTLSILTNVFTERTARAKAIGLWGATTGLGVAFGPICGGWLLEHFWWGSVFLALVPVALFVALLVAVAVPTSRDPDAPPADVVGLVLSTAAIGTLVFSIIEAPERGWTSVATLAGFGAAVALGATFVRWERDHRTPMLDVRLFANPRFSAASGAVAVAFFALFGFVFLVTQYFQFLKGYTPLGTGIRLLPVAASIAVASVVGTRLAVRIGNKAVVAGGLVSLTAGYLWVASASAATGYGEIVAQMILLGGGMGLTSAPATEAIMGAVTTEKAGIGSAVNDATRELGGTLGVAVIGSVFASLYSQRLADLPAFLPTEARDAAAESVGAAFVAADRVEAAGLPGVAEALRAVASDAFFSGFAVGCLVAAGVAALGALAAVRLLPSRPAPPAHDGTAAGAPRGPGADVALAQSPT
ncbi:MAG: MFS transporter [Acidimicrobiia bacterium]|nr:MAG: MFS transporter [Acidimicrobiia bacterium]